MDHCVFCMLHTLPVSDGLCMESNSHYAFCTLSLVQNMSSQWEGSKEQALYIASNEGDLAKVILSYWLVSSACYRVHHWLVSSACYRVHHLLLCGEGAGHDPKGSVTELWGSSGKSGVVESRVCLVE